MNVPVNRTVLTRARSLQRAASAIVIMALSFVGTPAMAQQTCHSICAPTLVFHPGVIWSHIFGGPRVTTNPFTEYTASDESSPIHANTASVGLNASVDAVTPKETGGWVGVSGYAGDLFSPAARPGDNADYTHKLDVGLIGTLNVFDWLPSATWAHDAVSAYAILDYVATGLPRVGDVVPKGVRRFDTAARPAALIAGLSIRLAPLTPPPGS